MILLLCKNARAKQQVLGLLVLALLFFVRPSSSAAEVTATYLYDLSNFTGTVRYEWSKMYADDTHKEFYAVRGDTIRVFNANGMEIYKFTTYDAGVEMVIDLAADKDGNIMILSYSMETGTYSLFVVDYRGEQKGRIEFKNIPQEFSDLQPNRMVYRDGKVYLVSLIKLKVVVTMQEGSFLEGIDLAPLVEVPDDKRSENDIFGFSVDREGNLLFTIPALGRAFVMAPDRKITQFGKRGSGPGKFGVPAGIVRDSSGNYLVADILRAVVMIFDKDFNFIKEFGYRGLKPGNLIGPRDLVIDGSDRLYVDQQRKRGISVFKIENK